MKKIKILHVLSDSNIGGAGRLLYNLADSIDKEKFEFIYVFPKGSKLIEFFRKDNSNCKIYTIANGKDKSFDIKASFEIAKIIKKVSPDIVHTHSALFARIGAKIVSFDKQRVVYTKHCVFETPKIYNLKIIKYIYDIFDGIFSTNIIAVADCAKKELVNCGIDPKKIKVIINGVKPLRKAMPEENEKTKRELNIPQNSFVVGISARLEKYKGHKTLLQAARLTKLWEIDDIVFLIMGGGSYEKELKRLTKELDINDRVIFLGFVDDISKYVNIFDINVNCSTGTETSSLAISEGLSIGKPAIASDYGGNPNMVVNGRTGFIFKQKNAWELFNKINLLKNNPELLKKMSSNARADFVKRFSSEIMAREYEAFYKQIILKKKRL